MFHVAATRKTRILDVVYNASNNELVRTKTLVKNAIVQVDAAPFRSWYQEHYLVALGLKKGQKLNEAEESLFNKKRSKKAQKKYEERRKRSQVEKDLKEQFETGRLYGTWAVAIFQDSLLSVTGSSGSTCASEMMTTL